MIKHKSNDEKEWKTTKIEENNSSQDEKKVSIEENTEEEKKPTESSPSKERSWTKKSGELAVDVYETENNIIIQAPIAGVKKDDLEVITEKDIVIIKGERERPEKEEIKGFYTQECFYGHFRREVVLPEETDPSRIEADIKDGVLGIKIPKIEREKRRKVDI